MRPQKIFILSLIFFNLAINVISQIYPQLEAKNSKRLIAINTAKDVVHVDSFDNNFEDNRQDETDIDQQLEETVFN